MFSCEFCEIFMYTFFTATISGILLNEYSFDNYCIIRHLNCINFGHEANQIYLIFKKQFVNFFIFKRLQKEDFQIMRKKGNENLHWESFFFRQPPKVFYKNTVLKACNFI